MILDILVLLILSAPVFVFGYIFIRVVRYYTK